MSSRRGFEMVAVSDCPSGVKNLHVCLLMAAQQAVNAQGV